MAHLHPDPAGFAGWLAGRLDGGSGTGGDRVRLATVHRVKGLEWPHVIIYEASAGLMPHRLAHDVEEERRVFHVALTRCSESVTLVCDDPASPFLPELGERAPPMPAVSEGVQAPTLAAGHDRPAESNRQKPEPPTDPQGAAVFEALREWRRERSQADGVPAFVVFHDSTLIEIAHRRPAVRAELLLVPGIGPTKLERYGDDVVALLARF